LALYDQQMGMLFTIGSDWLAANPPPESSLTETLAGVARQTIGGEDFRFAAREFLTEFPFRITDGSRLRAISERPEFTGDRRYDAYLGALAEHIADLYGLERPEWSIDPRRFLDTPWLLSEVPGFRATSIAEASPAFARHRVFIPERSLHRV
jgi:hypothetical protein